MSARQKAKTQIQAELEQHFQSGFYSHVYYECGLLRDEEPALVFQQGRDRRNIFDLASLTKALVTTPLIFSFLQKRSAQLGQTLKEVAPGAAKESNLPSFLFDLTFKEILAHKSGLPAWRNFWINRLTPDSSAQELQRTAHSHIETVFRRINLSLGQKTDLYSDLGFILLGYFLEKIQKKSLSQQFSALLREHFANAQGHVPSLGFFADFFGSDVIPTSFCSIRNRIIQGEVHDENAASLGGIAGHAGIFGSGLALSQFLRNFIHSPLGQFIIEENRKCTAANDNASLCGFRQGNDISFGKGLALGHYGFTGTAFWIDPASTRYVILLTNRVISGRVSSLTKPFRQKIFSLTEEFLPQS